jgi:hypothetical protein
VPSISGINIVVAVSCRISPLACIRTELHQ